MVATNFPWDKYIDTTLYIYMQHLCEKKKKKNPMLKQQAIDCNLVLKNS
jgi:hypothetical protein